MYNKHNVNHDTNMSVDVDRLVHNAWRTFRKNTLKLYDRPSAPLKMKILILKSEVVETILYDWVTWSPRSCHYDAMCLAHYNQLIRFPISYLEGYCVGGRSCSRGSWYI